LSKGSELFAGAAEPAARLVEEGFESERRPEERLRQAMIRVLHESGSVIETQPDLGASTELKPQLLEWPSLPGTPLGGIDLSVRVPGDELGSWRYLAELKWDALWMELWDAYKLCHAYRLAGVEEVFLIAIATERDWGRQTDGSELFSRDAAFSTEWLLLDRYRARWQQLLESSSRSRPQTVPSALAVQRVADVTLATAYGPSRLRISSVRPSGEWLAVTAEGWPEPSTPIIHEWPHPDPGPGMEASPGRRPFRWPATTAPVVTEDDLKPEDVPSADADWSRITWFAAGFDGYGELGSVQNLGAVGNLAREYWFGTNELPTMDLRTLRACLFFEYRRSHFQGDYPSSREVPYIRGLVEAIRDAVVSGATPP
jgi:hypothetical protein